MQDEGEIIKICFMQATKGLQARSVPKQISLQKGKRDAPEPLRAKNDGVNAVPQLH